MTKARTSLRLTPRQRALIERGCKASGTETLSEYVRAAAIVRACEDTGDDPAPYLAEDEDEARVAARRLRTGGV